MADRELVADRVAPPCAAPTASCASAEAPIDVFGWATKQADALRAGRLDLLDLPALADEIKDVGHAEYDKLESALTVLLQHMLKWDFQPERRSRSGELTIEEQRARVAKQLKRNPSLRSKLDEMVVDAFHSAVRRTYAETDLPRGFLPQVLSYTWTDMTERRFFHGD